MNPIVKSIATTVGGAVVLAIVWWVWGLMADPLVRKSAVDIYQLKVEAESRFELLAAENESDRLDTRLELVKIRIERFMETAKVRPLTDAEQIELRALEQERAAILQRLASKA